MGGTSAYPRRQEVLTKCNCEYFPFLFSEGRDLQHEEFRRARMSGTRRRFFQDAAIFGAGLLGMSKSLEAQAEKPMRIHPREANQSHARGPGAPLPMVTPDIADLPHELDGSVKVFSLVAEPVKKKIAPFKTI